MRRWLIAGLCALAPMWALASQEDDAFRLEPDGDRFYATGVLFPQSGRHIDQARQNNPEIRTVVMQSVPGSDDENEYLGAALKLRQAQFTTIIPSDGVVASGGTDFFLAGVTRIIEPGACIGVHSWADNGPPPYEATDVPRNHEDHADFLRYFRAIGIAEDFYWFTIHAAPADGMHWMSPDEINRFGMSTRPVPASSESEAARAARCFARLGGSA